MSRDGYQLDDRGSVTERCRDFVLRQHVQTDTGANLVSYYMSLGVSSPWIWWLNTRLCLVSSLYTVTMRCLDTGATLPSYIYDFTITLPWICRNLKWFLSQEELPTKILYVFLVSPQAWYMSLLPHYFSFNPPKKVMWCANHEALCYVALCILFLLPLS